MGRIANAWAALTGKTAATMDADTFAQFLRSQSGPRKNASEALAAWSNSPRFRAVVQRVAESIALNPWEVYLTAPGVSASHLRAQLRAGKHDPIEYRRHLRRLTKGGAVRQAPEIEPLAEREPGHPFVQLMRHPNRILRWHGSIEVIQQNMDIVGRCYVWIRERDSKGRPTEWLPLSSTQVSRATERGDVRIQFAGRTLAVPSEDVLTLYKPDPADPYTPSDTGLGMTLSDELDTDENAAKTASARLRNHGVPDAVVTVEGANATEAKAIEAHMLAKYQGVDKRGKPHITNKKVTVQQIAEKLADMSLVELRAFEARVMWTTFGVPPEILGLVESSNRATSEAAEEIFARWVLWPRLCFLADWLQNDMAPLTESSDRILVVPTSPVPEDREARDRLLKIAPWGVEINAAREWLGEQPDDRLEGLVWLPSNGKPATIEAVRKMAQEAAQSAPTAPAAEPEDDDPEDPDDDPSGGGGGSDDEGSDDDAEQGAEDGGEAAPKSVFAPVSEQAKAEMERLGINSKLGASVPPTVGELIIRDALGLTKEDLGVDQKVERVTAALKPERLTTSTRALWERELRAWMMRAARQAGADLSFDMLNPLIAPHLETFGGQRIVMINDTTRDAIKRALAEGVRAGEGAEALGRRVRDVFATASRSRAVTIARTEVLRSSNWGATAAYRATGLVERREWLATPDGRTRDAHRLMDGQTVDIDAKFRAPGGEEADHPGGFNVAALDVNCRCFVAPVVDDQVRDAEARTKLWKAADEDATKWEGAAIHAFRAGFREQERDVLDALGMVFGEAAA